MRPKTRKTRPPVSPDDSALFRFEADVYDNTMLNMDQHLPPLDPKKKRNALVVAADMVTQVNDE